MRDKVQRYYGEVLQSSADLKTNACCTIDDVRPYLSDIIAQIHSDVRARYYGCGLILPEALEGAQILDLGCGAGRDCYVLSRLAGPRGRVVGVDMTPEQLQVACSHRDYHAAQFGYSNSKVEFILADIERLDDTDLEDNRFDLIVSNCVINLVNDKRAVLDQTYRLLKPGGEMYFADVYSDRRVPSALKMDPELFTECLSGALYCNDFLSLAKIAGFTDPRLVTDRPLTIEAPTLQQKVGDIRFFSATYRLFKLEQLEPGGEDYGQTVCYLGNIPHHPDRLVLDKCHIFEVGKTEAVSGNTYMMLAESRFAAYFEFHGDRRDHAGMFRESGASLPFDELQEPSGTGCC
jgi:ubiquinone/menaquinone biosynthesis C-methylase UbiE